MKTEQMHKYSEKMTTPCLIYNCSIDIFIENIFCLLELKLQFLGVVKHFMILEMALALISAGRPKQKMKEDRPGILWILRLVKWEPKHHQLWADRLNCCNLACPWNKNAVQVKNKPLELTGFDAREMITLLCHLKSDFSCETNNQVCCQWVNYIIPPTIYILESVPINKCCITLYAEIVYKRIARVNANGMCVHL